MLRLQHGIGEVLVAQLAAGKEALGKADAAHLATGKGLVFKPFTYDEFGAAAADIDHQYLTLDMLGMGNPLIDEPCFFLPADDLDGVVEHLGCFTHKFAGVAGAAQGIGTCDADLIRLDVGEPLGKQRQAGETAFHRLRAHAFLLIHPFRQPHSLLDAIDDAKTPFAQMGDHHVKTVGAEIYGGIETIVHCLTRYV